MRLNSITNHVLGLMNNQVVLINGVMKVAVTTPSQRKRCLPMVLSDIVLFYNATTKSL